MRRGALVLLLALLVGMVISPVHTVYAGKGNPDHITFVKLSDIEFRDESGQGITMTKGWLKNLLKVEWGFGSYTNATLVWDGKRLTVYLQDDTKHDGRWFALNEQILKKVGIDPDAVNIKLDTNAPAETVKRLDEDGKWFYFYIDHFTVRYVTFEAEEGYVELSDFGWQNYTKLIEPDPYCEDCAVFIPFDDLVQNPDGSYSMTIYKAGNPEVVTIPSTDSPTLVSGLKSSTGNAIELRNSTIGASIDIETKGGFAVAFWTKVINPNTANGFPDFWRLSNGTTYARIEVSSVGNFAIAGMTPYTGLGNYVNMTVFIVANFDYESSTVNVRVYDENGTLLNEKTITLTTEVQRWTSLKIQTKEAGEHDIIRDDMFIFDHPIDQATIDLLLHLGRYRYALYRGDEANLPAYLDATLFCPLDSINPDNTTTCYLNGAEQSATVYFNSTTGYPRLASGVIGNAFDFKEGAYIQTNFDWNESRSLSVFAFFRVDELPGHYWNDIVYLTGNRLSVTSSSILRFKITLDDGSSVEHGTEVELGKAYAVLWTIDTTNKITRLVLWNAETREKLFDQSWSFAENIKSNTGNARISNAASYGLNGMIDEVRIYEGRVLSDDEVQLLLHINRYKTAVLSAPSASYNGTHFLVNVTATLPNDGGSYLLPAPASAVSSYTSAGTIGNFTFLDVGTASTASFQVPVPKDLTPPAGINLLAWMYNDEIYVTGRSDQFPLIATVMNLPKGVWGLENGRVVKNVVYKDYTKLIIANISGPSYVSRLPNLFVEPQGVDYVNVSVLRHSPEGVEINASAPGEGDVVFTVGGLWKDHRYNLYVDGDKIETLKTSDTGWLTFTWSDWSDHIIYIQPYSAGEEFLYDMGDIAVAMMMGAIIAPLASLIYIFGLYSRQAYGRDVDWNKTLDFLIEEFVKFLIIAWIAIAGLTALVMVALSI